MEDHDINSPVNLAINKELVTWVQDEIERGKQSCTAIVQDYENAIAECEAFVNVVGLYNKAIEDIPDTYQNSKNNINNALKSCLMTVSPSCMELEHMYAKRYDILGINNAVIKLVDGGVKEIDNIDYLNKLINEYKIQHEFKFHNGENSDDDVKSKFIEMYNKLNHDKIGEKLESFENETEARNILIECDQCLEEYDNYNYKSQYEKSLLQQLIARWKELEGEEFPNISKIIDYVFKNRVLEFLSAPCLKDIDEVVGGLIKQGELHAPTKDKKISVVGNYSNDNGIKLNFGELDESSIDGIMEEIYDGCDKFNKQSRKNMRKFSNDSSENEDQEDGIFNAQPQYVMIKKPVDEQDDNHEQNSERNGDRGNEGGKQDDGTESDSEPFDAKNFKDKGNLRPENHSDEEKDDEDRQVNQSSNHEDRNFEVHDDHEVRPDRKPSDNIEVKSVSFARNRERRRSCSQLQNDDNNLVGNIEKSGRSCVENSGDRLLQGGNRRIVINELEVRLDDVVIKEIVQNAQNACASAENVAQAKTNFTNSIVELVNEDDEEKQAKIREAAEKLFDRYISCDEKGFVAAVCRFIVAVQAYIMGTKDKLFGSEEQKAQRWQECVAERCAEVIANKAQKIAAAL